MARRIGTRTRPGGDPGPQRAAAAPAGSLHREPVPVPGTGLRTPISLTTALGLSGAAGVVRRLQGAYGNAAVQRLLAAAPVSRPPTAAVPTAVVDAGGTGSAPLEPVPLPFGGGGSAAAPQRTNEWGEIDGAMVSDTPPTAFVGTGKTGSATVHWGGGTGGRGNQGVGSVDLTAPAYDGQDEVAEVKNAKGKVTQAHKPAKAWIQAGTGKAKVTRSYVGVKVGANGSYYITGRAASRIDVHEMKHVTSSKTIHNTTLKPLERRVGKRRGKGNAKAGGTTTAEATTALQTEIDWNTTVSAFSTQDTTANTPLGTTDTTDQSAANFYADYGPRKVKGTDYVHYVDTPPGPK